MRSSASYIVLFGGNYSTYLHVVDFSPLSFLVLIYLLLMSPVSASCIMCSYLPTHSILLFPVLS